jgi:hypothetical protein
MKPQKIETIWRNAHLCFVSRRNEKPVIQDLLYCSLMFMREAMIGSFGHRPKSSSRLALELAAKRPARVRLYRRMSLPAVPQIILPSGRRNLHKYV